MAEVDDIRESAHARTPNIAFDDHPPPRIRRQPENLSLELVHKLRSQARRSLVIEVPGFPEFLLDLRMILEGHRRSRAISSAWEIG
jgi:hypothetical protein